MQVERHTYRMGKFPGESFWIKPVKLVNSHHILLTYNILQSLVNVRVRRLTCDVFYFVL